MNMAPGGTAPNPLIPQAAEEQSALQGNPLIPPGAPPAPGPSIPGGPTPAPDLATPQLTPAQVIAQDATTAQLHYDQLAKIGARLEPIVIELGKLSSLKDTVTPEDIVKASGRLIARGEDPMKMAALLAQMPPGENGTQLAQWIGQQDARMQAKKAELAQATEAARHQLGVTALRSLVLSSKAKGGAV